MSNAFSVKWKCYLTRTCMQVVGVFFFFFFYRTQITKKIFRKKKYNGMILICKPDSLQPQYERPRKKILYSEFYQQKNIEFTNNGEVNEESVNVSVRTSKPCKAANRVPLWPIIMTINYVFKQTNNQNAILEKKKFIFSLPYPFLALHRLLLYECVVRLLQSLRFHNITWLVSVKNLCSEFGVSGILVLDRLQ